ncbi:MAG: hypothetical protein E3J66_01940 [Dehalococcoidia bacterium]|nr:MAG: hypothetical protein E3J66_01940 [Dehalococcoidia bacterium]
MGRAEGIFIVCWLVLLTIYPIGELTRLMIKHPDFYALRPDLFWIEMLSMWLGYMVAMLVIVWLVTKVSTQEET